MLLTYKNYNACKQALITRFGDYKNYPTPNNYIKKLIKYNAVDAKYRSSCLAKLHIENFYDYIIFLHYFNRNDISFENSDGVKFKLDVNVNRRLNWKIFKSLMKL